MTATPKVDAAYLKALKDASADIKAVLDTTKSHPLFIRLAFADSLTFEAATNTSGANGTVRWVFKIRIFLCTFSCALLGRAFITAFSECPSY